MAFLFLAVTAIVLVTSNGKDILFGTTTFAAGKAEYECDNVTFPSPFASRDVHVHITLYNADVKGNTYQAAVGWVEDVTASTFRACAVTSGPYRDMKTLRVNWMAYHGTPEGSQNGRHTFSLFTSGTLCEEVFFPTNYTKENSLLSFGLSKISPTAATAITKKFHGKPDVYATPIHTVTGERKDAATIWVENIGVASFKACMRELKNYNGAHKSIKVDWMALRFLPGKWKAKEKKRLKMLNEGQPPKGTKYSFCNNATFAQKFYKPPVIITTASHDFDKNNPRSISPKTNTISSWLENLDTKGFQICMKDGQKLKKKHTPIEIQYMVLGDLDPCLNVICSFYGVCLAFGPSDARCVCDHSCASYEDMVCNVAGVTYKNLCEYKKAMCENKQNIPIAHAGSCRPFILQRGRTQLLLDVIDVQCREVLYNSSWWYTSLPVHVLVMVNYDGEATSVVHDAITTWVEKISHSKFVACVLKAGRNEYEGLVPTNYGITSIDWIAFQGAPRGGVVGEEVISKWWEGTSCKSLTLPVNKFASSPFILLTAEHTRVNLKHDAATLWSEDVKSGTFKVCLRELQNFDGLHKDIRVNWMAFEDLPRNLFSEHDSLYFANTQLPLESNRNAYCQNVEFKMKYRSVPTILVSATHNSTRAGSLSPIHNSIASWVENVGTRGFRVCMKELHESNKYDPVSVSWVALPECNLALEVSNPSIIPNSAMNASSQLTPSPEYAGASQGRLNLLPVKKTFMGAWCAASNTGQWLQVDLGHLHVVSGVATQGSTASKFRYWVTSYKLAYSNDGMIFKEYKENTITRVFRGNSNIDSVVRNTFQDPLEMRFLRFLPLGYRGHVCMRTEIYGCDTEPIHVRILSEGCDDNPTRCGFSSIEVDGIEHSFLRRGHNVVALDQEGNYVGGQSFDTYGNPSSGAELATFITNLPQNTIVLIAVQESGDSYIRDAENALRSIFASDPLFPDHKGSWALVGFKGSFKPSWFRQAYNKKGLGPTLMSISIPLYGK